ncbi:glycosyltransferase family 4 protein [Sphingomonas yunnanensis]|uniref:glycosyltransferase family 4 protein n=1 Tax=Sphingomonas yunnanensis TaxID=310400 RepID=UPI001CA686BA|nr:glycosyltransferase family 4 protein [Sphingomonas yunnanensis]MBY9063460.1 glycosyltransferase family 4 protein [Sphingomonas yunnanensis]
MTSLPTPHCDEPAAAVAGTVLIAGRCAETIYRQRRMLARALRDAGWTVHLCGDAGDGDDARYGSELEKEGFVFHPLALDQRARDPRSALRLLLSYRALVRQIRPDVVHVFNAKPTMVGLLGCALGGRTVRVATVAGLGHVFMARSRMVRTVGRVAFRAALRLADVVVFYNEDDRRTFLTLGLVAPEKTRLIAGSGVDLARFAAVPLPDSDVLEVLFVGRLLREKGIDAVVAAGRELRRRGAPIRITVVGDIDHHNPSSLDRPAIEAAVAEGAVRWLGPRHDVVPGIAASHVVLLPSHREGLPLALVEGSAMARALVATDVPGCRDVVRDGVNGLLVPLGDTPALVDALLRLAGDRRLCERLGQEGARLARARYAAAAVGGEVAALYDQTMASLDRRWHLRQI